MSPSTSSQRCPSAVGIEPRLEELDEELGDAGMRHQGVIGVALGETGPDPSSIGPIGAEEADLGMGQVGEDDETVERVDLGLTGQSGFDGGNESRSAPLHIEQLAVLTQYADVVDEHVDVIALDASGNLFDDP